MIGGILDKAKTCGLVTKVYTKFTLTTNFAAMT